jgi:hypothetical protein
VPAGILGGCSSIHRGGIIAVSKKTAFFPKGFRKGPDE